MNYKKQAIRNTKVQGLSTELYGNTNPVNERLF